MYASKDSMWREILKNFEFWCLENRGMKSFIETDINNSPPRIEERVGKSKVHSFNR